MLQTLSFTPKTLRLGQRISVRKINESTTYNSILEEINDDSLSIAFPVFQGLFMYPTAIDAYTLTVHCETGIFTFECHYLSHTTTPIGIIKLSTPTKMIKLQNRENVRINDYIQLTLQPKDSNIKIDGATKNISVGGMLISTLSKMGVGDEIHINFKLATINKNVDINLKGMVVRTADPTEKAHKNFYGVKFLEVDEKISNHLTHYIFKRQAQMIKLMKET
jgi:c-di-GMP-binding flagellar brake protein YcgR